MSLSNEGSSCVIDDIYDVLVLYLSALVYNVDLVLNAATAGAGFVGNVSDVASGNGEFLITGEQFIALYMVLCQYF